MSNNEKWLNIHVESLSTKDSQCELSIEEWLYFGVKRLCASMSASLLRSYTEEFELIFLDAFFQPGQRLHEILRIRGFAILKSG